VIRRASREHLADHFAIAIHALHLIKRTLIMIKTQPLHAIQNGLHGLGRGTLQIGVFDTQNEGAAKTTCISPRKQRGAGAAKVKVTGGAGGKAGANSHDQGAGAVGKTAILEPLPKWT
jgi:hypothetical protein